MDEIICLATDSTEKCKIIKKMIYALKCFKQHDGLATAIKQEKLKSFTESEIIAGAVLLQRATRPNAVLHPD